MEFEVDAAARLKLKDVELTELLTQVYVTGGFTTSTEAASLFDAAAVRARGTIIGAREKRSSDLAGIVIVVPPSSPARRLANDNEAEMHLLGVKPAYRGYGVGRMLVVSAIGNATQSGYSKMILWTQHSMRAAQQLYEDTGFIHVADMTRNGRDFKVYEKVL